MVEAKIMRGVIFITHDLPVLSMVTDRLAVMSGGRLLRSRPPLRSASGPTGPSGQPATVITSAAQSATEI